ncbi:MAG: hypothetical protein ACOYL8_00570 [Patescibacteria group bacterium]
MNWYSIFYWLTVADSVKNFFDSVSNIFTFFAVVFFIILIIASIGKAVTPAVNNDKDDEEEKTDSEVRSWEKVRIYSQKFFYPFLAVALITWFGYVLTPTKKDCLLIVAGGSVGNFISSDSTAKQLPGDVTKFLHLSLKKEISELSADGRKEIGIQTPKEKLLDKAVNMSKEELINYLKSDSTRIGN